MREEAILAHCGTMAGQGSVPFYMSYNPMFDHVYPAIDPRNLENHSDEGSLTLAPVRIYGLTSSPDYYIYTPRYQSYDEEVSGVQIDTDQGPYIDYFNHDHHHQHIQTPIKEEPTSPISDLGFYESPHISYSPPVFDVEDLPLPQDQEYFRNWSYGQFTPPVSPKLKSEEPMTPCIPTVPTVPTSPEPRKRRSRASSKRPPRRSRCSNSPEEILRADRFKDFGPNSLNHLLLELRDVQNLPWKICAQVVRKRSGQSVNIPALQMRLKRYRDRIRVWGTQNSEQLSEAQADIGQPPSITESRNYVIWLANAMSSLGLGDSTAASPSKQLDG